MTGASGDYDARMGMSQQPRALLPSPRCPLLACRLLARAVGYHYTAPTLAPADSLPRSPRCLPLQIVAGGRYIRMLRSSEEEGEGGHGTSVLGVTGEEGASRRLSQEIFDASRVPAELSIKASGGGGAASLLSPSGAGGYNADAVAAAAGLGVGGVVIAGSRASSAGAGAEDAEDAASEGGSSSGGGGLHGDMHSDMLAALDAARAVALSRQRQREVRSLAGSRLFATPPAGAAGRRSASFAERFSPEGSPFGEDAEAEGLGGDEEDEDDEEGEEGEEAEGDGDLGGGSGDASTRFQHASQEEGGVALPAGSSTGGRSRMPRGGAGPGGRSKTGSFLEDLPKKPSRWTRQFLKTQKDAAPAFAPFQWTKYHKK